MITNPHWKYRTAEQSRKPGYLAKRFAQLRREQAAAKPVSNVATLKKAVG